jgi:hypothetical protein
MSKPNSLPSYDGEIVLTHQEVKLVDDALSEPLVDIHVEIHQATNLPSATGLALQWVRKAGWIQLPVDQLWTLSGYAQVPLRKLKLLEEFYEQTQQEQ